MREINLKDTLKKSLEGATKIAVLGVGSDLRADDVAGTLVAEKIRKLCGKRRKKNPGVQCFFGATAPENLTGEINRFKPSHFVILDSADVGHEPGTIELIPPEMVGGVSFSTHLMPIKVMVDYVQRSTGAKTLIIGIQPKTLEYNEPPSKEVQESVTQVAAALAEVIKSL